MTHSFLHSQIIWFFHFLTIWRSKLSIKNSRLHNFKPSQLCTTQTLTSHSQLYSSMASFLWLTRLKHNLSQSERTQITSKANDLAKKDFFDFFRSVMPSSRLNHARAWVGPGCLVVLHLKFWNENLTNTVRIHLKT